MRVRAFSSDQHTRERCSPLDVVRVHSVRPARIQQFYCNHRRVRFGRTFVLYRRAFHHSIKIFSFRRWLACQYVEKCDRRTLAGISNSNSFQLMCELLSVFVDWMYVLFVFRIILQSNCIFNPQCTLCTSHIIDMNQLSVCVFVCMCLCDVGVVDSIGCKRLGDACDATWTCVNCKVKLTHKTVRSHNATLPSYKAVCCILLYIQTYVHSCRVCADAFYKHSSDMCKINPTLYIEFGPTETHTAQTHCAETCPARTMCRRICGQL